MECAPSLCKGHLVYYACAQFIVRFREGNMAASLICGRFSASLRNSGARSILTTASKVSVRWKKGDEIRLPVAVIMFLLHHLRRPKFPKKRQGHI